MRFIVFTLTFCVYCVGISSTYASPGNVLSTILHDEEIEEEVSKEEASPPEEVGTPYTLENGSLPTNVQQEFNNYPITCSSGDGVFRPKGFTTCRDNGRLYIYLCYVLNNLAYTMEIMHCTVFGNTLRVYARPIKNGKREGLALHNSVKIISVMDSRKSITQLQLMTYDSTIKKVVL